MRQSTVVRSAHIWQSTGGAVSQIKENGYQNILENYGGDVILVGINYDNKTKKHVCEIERIGGRLA